METRNWPDDINASKDEDFPFERVRLVGPQFTRMAPVQERNLRENDVEMNNKLVA